MNLMFSEIPSSFTFAFTSDNKFPVPATRNTKSFLFFFNSLITSKRRNGLFCSVILQINPITYSIKSEPSFGFPIPTLTLMKFSVFKLLTTDFNPL